MGTSIRSAIVEAATFSLGATYTGETGPGTPAYVDVGLTSGGTRIRQELEIVELLSEQLGGPYGFRRNKKRIRIEVNLDQGNIFNIAAAWGYANSDIISSSALVIDDQELAERSARIAGSTTKDTAAGTAGVRNFDMWKVVQIENSELNVTVEDKMVAPLSLSCALDSTGTFGRLEQSVSEAVPA